MTRLPSAISGAGAVMALLLFADGLTGAGAQTGGINAGELDCVIEPHMVVKLGSPDAGVLAEVPVDRGDLITRGQVVAKLDSRIESATVELARVRAKNDVELRSANARLVFRQKEYARTKRLHAKKVISSKVMQETERELALAKLAVREAKLASQLAQLEHKRAREVLRQRTLRSPIDGVVVERSLSPGEYIFEQTHVMTLAQINPLNVEVFVPNSLFGSIEIGDRAAVKPSLPGAKIYSASVKIVDQVFDAASGTFGVRLDLPNADRKLPSGVKCKITFLGQARADRTQ